MKRAIRPAGLLLLALVLSAAAPAPDVRAAPPWTVPHGDAAGPRDPLPSALRSGPLDDQVQGSGVAFDGTNYLVVWTDLREGARKVYGARVSPDGTVLDEDGFAISAAGGSGPAVAFDGTNYLVVWSNQDSIVGARVDPDGTVLDPGGIPISTQPGVELYPTLAFDGTNYLVAWITGYAEDVYGARVSPSGTVLDPAGIEIAVRAGFQETSPSVAFDGTNYLVVWQEIPCNRILGRRVSQSGVPDGEGSFLIADCFEDPGNVWIRHWDPAVAFDGVNYLVTWVYFYGDFGGWTTNISGARVTPARTVLDTFGLTGGNHRDPALAVAGLRRLDVPRRLVRRLVGRRGRPWSPRHARRIRPRFWRVCDVRVWGSRSRGRLRRHELPRRLGQRGRRLRDARDPSGRCARLERIPDHDKRSASASTPLRSFDHDPRSQPCQSVPVHLLYLGPHGHDHGRQSLPARRQPQLAGRHRHPARRPAGPGRDRDVGCGRRLWHRHRPDARRRGRITAAGQQHDRARELPADELRARRSVPGPGADADRQRRAVDVRRDEPEWHVEPLRRR